MFKYAFISKYLLEKNSRTVWIEREIYLSYSLLINLLININIIKIVVILVYLRRDIIIVRFKNSIVILVIKTSKSEKVLKTIFLIKTTIIPL